MLHSSQVLVTICRGDSTQGTPTNTEQFRQGYKSYDTFPVLSMSDALRLVRVKWRWRHWAWHIWREPCVPCLANAPHSFFIDFKWVYLKGILSIYVGGGIPYDFKFVDTWLVLNISQANENKGPTKTDNFLIILFVKTNIKIIFHIVTVNISKVMFAAIFK